MLYGVSLRPVSQTLGTPRTHRERISSRDGYFAPESVIRRVGDTPIVPLLGGGTAVLLQVAHPLVAAGVVEHSDYRSDLWSRLTRTLRALYLIVYGTKKEAEDAAAVVRAVHAHVHGVTRRRLGRFPAGTPYSASTPELMLWVHGTLVQASLAAYERFVERLSPADAESYYQEMALVARLFGTPDSVIPGSFAEFREYFASELDCGDICVTDPARDVASVILEAPMPTPLRLLAPAHRLATAGLLPPKLRDEYGLRWGTLHARSLPLAAHSLRLGATPLLYIASRLASSTYTRAA
jgi:uncharacterized protein (DUF2236 family)